MFVPNGFNYDFSNTSGSRLKFLRIRTVTAGNKNIGYNDWYINSQYNTGPAFLVRYEGQAGTNFLGSFDKFFGPSPADKIQQGVWETYEYYVKLDTVPVDSGGQARVRTYKNGKLLKDVTDMVTLRDATAKAPSFLLFTFWNGGAPKTQTLFVDDLVLTTDRPAALDSTGHPYIGMGATGNAKKTTEDHQQRCQMPLLLFHN